MKTFHFTSSTALFLSAIFSSSSLAFAIPHDEHTSAEATASPTSLAPTPTPTTSPFYPLFYEKPQSHTSSAQETECAPATTVTATIQAPEYPAVTITNSYTVIIPTELASSLSLLPSRPASGLLPPYAVNGTASATGTGTAVGTGSFVVPTGGMKTTLRSSVVSVPPVTRTTIVNGATSTWVEAPVFTGAAERVGVWGVKKGMAVGMLGAVVGVWGLW